MITSFTRSRETVLAIFGKVSEKSKFPPAKNISTNEKLEQFLIGVVINLMLNSYWVKAGILLASLLNYPKEPYLAS